MENQIKIRLRFVIIKNDKLLAYYDSIDKYYFYIGGRLEFGETMEEGWKREIKEEIGNDAEFTFKKILYVRDFILKEKSEHSLELPIFGDINKFMEIDGRHDPEYDGRKFPKWLDLDSLPDSLYPKSLTKKLLEDYSAGFLNEGEYLGRI